MEPYTRNGSIIGKTMDFGATDFYSDTSASLNYVGFTDGTQQNTSAYSITGVNLGPAIEKKVVGILSIIDTSGNIQANVISISGATGYNIRSTGNAGTLTHQIIFDWNTSATSANLIFNMAALDTYEGGLQVYYFDKTSVTFVENIPINNNSTVTPSYSAGDFFIGGGSSVNATTGPVWTGDVTEDNQSDYRTSELFAVASSPIFTTSGTASINCNIDGIDPLVNLVKYNSPGNKKNSGIWDLQAVLERLSTPAIPTYQISESTVSVDEAFDVTFTVNTTNVADATTLYWNITSGSTVNASDFMGGATSGSFTITNNVGQFTRTLAFDETTEGSESFSIEIRTGSNAGPVVATSATITVNDTSRTPPTGQQEYTIPGTYSWTAPADVYVVSVVAIGGGGGGEADGSNNNGGAGGGLGWRNNIAVTPGNSYTVVVGAGGTRGTVGGNGGNSYFINTSTVAGFGGAGGGEGEPNSGGSYFGDAGGTGGRGGNGNNRAAGGGGGAAGYTGNGGQGADLSSAGSDAAAGSGGGGGGGAGGSADSAGGGGGVGIYGQGADGLGGFYNGNNGGGGGGGSGGADGIAGDEPQGDGGLFGGGGGGADNNNGEHGNGAGGAVRIIWGPGREFPSTNTGDL